LDVSRFHTFGFLEHVQSFEAFFQRFRPTLAPLRTPVNVFTGIAANLYGTLPDHDGKNRLGQVIMIPEE